MSLPAWNRKAPSRAAIAATLSALTVFGASSVATADVSQNPYQQPAFGYGFQGQQQLPAAPYGPGFGYGPQAASFAAPVQSAPPQGYAQPVPQGYGQPAPVPGFGLPQPAPGFGLPGGYPVPGAPAPGFGPYGGGFPGFGPSSQWGHFAPSEPNYAPHERAGAQAPAPVAAVASAPAARPAPAAQASAKQGTKPAAPASATTSDYSYELAPATNSTYVGSSTQYSAAPTTYADPYQSIANQQSGGSTYQITTPAYTQQYDTQVSAQPAAPDYSNYVAAPEYNVSPSYTAPAAAPAPAPNYTVAAPAPLAPTNTGGYEYQGSTSYETASPSYQQATPSYQQAAPSYQQQPAQSYQQAAPAPSYQQNPQSYEQAPADYYDLSASAAAAAAAVAAPAYEVAAYAPPQQAAPRGGHFVQVGAFLDQARAARLVNKLGASGQQAFIVPAQVRGRLYHRVRISGGSKRDARAIRNQVRELGYYEARVVKG